MATNNLLVNNERKVLYDQQSKVERSGHNLSQSRKFPCDVGYIYPFFCRKTLPSDSFKISADILIKQLQPLLVPQMVSFTVNTAFYWVDYSLAFPDFEYFLINQRGSQSIELPYVHLPNRQLKVNGLKLPSVVANPVSPDEDFFELGKNLRSFLDFSVNACDEKIDALPFWTYQTIIRDYYLNIDRLSTEEYNDYFPSDINKWKLRQGVNYAIGDYSIVDGSIQGHYINLARLRPHNVRGDYFVNSYPTPLRGDIPTLQYDSSLSDLTANFVADLSNKLSIESISEKELVFNNVPVDNSQPLLVNTAPTYSTLSHNVPSNTPYPVKVRTYATGSNVWDAIQNNFINFKDYFNNTFSGKLSLSNLSNFDTSISISTRQLRLLESLTRKREIDIMMKPRLKNYLETYFGVNRYKDESLYQPVFIGSTTQQILINDIAQTTATSDSPLGRQGATAMSLGSGYVGEYYCRNYGCLMGVMYILPDYDYEPAIPKEWQERTPDDFVNPEFTHLSMQPILNKELFVSSDNDWNNEVLGYMGMYDNYRTSQNLVAGEFLNSDYQDIRQFAQVRRFYNNNKPEITTSFLDSNSAFDRTVFATPSLPPFIAQCVARVEAVRPLPQIAIPRG